MCVDNFFVPNLFLFNVSNFIKIFNSLGFKKTYQSNIRLYDHSVNKKDNTGISLCFEKDKELKFVRKKFKSIDQIKDINYKEDYIKNTNKILSKYLKKIHSLNNEKRINLAIDLLFICQSYRIFKYYNKSSKGKFDELNSLSCKYSSAKKIHLAIQKRILLEF